MSDCIAKTCVIIILCFFCEFLTVIDYYWSIIMYNENWVLKAEPLSACVGA